MEKRSLEHWFLDKQGKLAGWREWRETLASMNSNSVYQEAAEWWKFVPLVNKTFDPWRQETWPNPWELVGSGAFCPSAQGLGIFYSLVLSGYECELMLAIIDDHPRLLVLLPSKKLLNYYDGEVIDIAEAKLQILQTWVPSDLARLVKV